MQGPFASFERGLCKRLVEIEPIAAYGTNKARLHHNHRLPHAFVDDDVAYVWSGVNVCLCEVTYGCCREQCRRAHTYTIPVYEAPLVLLLVRHNIFRTLCLTRSALLCENSQKPSTHWYRYAQTLVLTVCPPRDIPACQHPLIASSSSLPLQTLSCMSCRSRS